MRSLESTAGEAELRELCRATLERNWREGNRDGVGYAYTAPSSGRYRGSGTGTRASARSSGAASTPLARAELESLLVAASANGFIGHTIFWAEPVSRVRSLFYNVRSRTDFM